MAQFENKSFSVSMRSSSARADLAERWDRTFPKEAAVAKPPAVIIPDVLPRNLMLLYALLNSEWVQDANEDHRDCLTDAMDVIYWRMTPEERTIVSPPPIVR